MLKTPMLIQAFFPNRIANWLVIPYSYWWKLWKHRVYGSQLISEMISANKIISKLLSTWLNETMDHSTSNRRNNHTNRPKFTVTFIYQEQLTIEKYKSLISSGTNNTLEYPTVINCAEWTNCVKTLFNWFTRQLYLDHTSLSTPRSRHPTKKFTPPYGLTFASFTDDVGFVDTRRQKTRTVEAGHMNGYLIIPGIVYHLSTKLQKGVMHDHLGQDRKVELIEFLTQFGYATRKSPKCSCMPHIHTTALMSMR